MSLAPISYTHVVNTTLQGSSRAQKSEDLLDILAERTNTQSASLVFETGSLVTQWMRLVPFLSSEQSQYLNHVGSVFGTAGDSCVIPDLISDVNNLRHRVQDLKSAMGTDAQAEKTKQVALTGLALVGDSGLACNTLGVLGVIGRSSAFMPLFYGSYAMTNVSEIIDEGKVLQENLQKQSPKHPEKVKERIHLSLLRLVKSTSYFALCVLGLLAAAYGALMQGIAILPAVTLLLTTVYISSRVAGLFYERQAHISSQLIKV